MTGRHVFVLLILLMIICIINNMFTITQAYADSLRNALPQRIGNYNVEMKTDPTTPISGQNAKIFLKISSVNRDDLVDLPIIINISKDGFRQETTHPIFVPYGHYTDEFIFKEPGIYSLDVIILDDVYTGQNLTVTFPITVTTPLLGYFSNSSSSSVPFIATIVIIASTSGVILIYKRKRRAAKNIEHTGSSHEDRY
ncbi:MAG TPA: hypothetical protein VK553_05825 [Candidatus Nitrosopolaris rasttigaisensis]|nr:hypothetical protein [Candidatus Nitrosopolaris rasttigaisensis]